MISIINLLIGAMICVTILLLAFMTLLSLPQCKMREVVKNGLLAVICLIYVLSPLDFVPEIAFGPVGVADDLGALVIGMVAAKRALKESQQKSPPRL